MVAIKKVYIYISSVETIIRFGTVPDRVKVQEIQSQLKHDRVTCMPGSQCTFIVLYFLKQILIWIRNLFITFHTTRIVEKILFMMLSDLPNAVPANFC